jgi:hypothetical protein
VNLLMAKDPGPWVSQLDMQKTEVSIPRGAESVFLETLLVEKHTQGLSKGRPMIEFFELSGMSKS